MEFIETGIAGLDEIIGGWPKGIMTLLVGETGVGKSTLLITSARSIADRGVKVFYIDAEGNPVENVSSNIVVEHACQSMDSLEEALEKLSRLPSNILANSLIIVDSITYHYHALIRIARTDSERDELQSVLEKLVYKLHGLTVKNNTATVLTTWPTSFGEEESDYVGGFAVKTYTRLQLKMGFTERDNVRSVKIVKWQDPSKYGLTATVKLGELALNIFKSVGGVIKREA
ncbi:MAG: ATPase domain-containing protein [Nitrososphaerota archaeon]